jgi:3-oxoacyl-[acyl-carrier protein] reductase
MTSGPRTAVDLSSRIAVVTGASRGIGLHIAKALHAAGASVAITGRREDTLAAAARAVGERCRPFRCDQRDPAAVQAMAEAVIAAMGPPDLLVNNAASIKLGTPVAELALDDWNKVIETNLTGVFVTTRAFLPAMLRLPRSDIFMISSMSGKRGDPNSAAYTASKFGMQGLAQSLMYEVRKHNIRVMVLNPSMVEKGEDGGPAFGKGLYLHAADLAATIVHLACLPGRTMIRDMDIYGTNPP